MSSLLSDVVICRDRRGIYPRMKQLTIYPKIQITTGRVSHVNQLGVLEKSDHFQNFRVGSVAQIMGIAVLKFQKIIFWSISKKVFSV